MSNKIEDLSNLVGKMITGQNRIRASLDLEDHEFKVSSQWGEDGIIQFLIDKVPIENRVFIEFGVEDYTESNTRYLLQNDNWQGLIIDGSDENIETIKSSELFWKHSLTAVAEFITKDNINTIILNAGISGDIGLLSIDVDGNDYWILEAIDSVSPRILVIEYNSIFGKNAEMSTPYDEKFDRNKKHYSGLYFGASIAAISQLAKRKGYSLVGSNTAGCNLFFVKNEFMSELVARIPEEAYVESLFRQSRDEHGNLTFLNNKEGLRLIGDLKVVETSSGKDAYIKDIVK